MNYLNNNENKKDNIIQLKKRIIKNEKIEEESTKNDESSLSSSSSIKKYGNKKYENNFLNINYSINNNPITNKKNIEKKKNELYSIKEEKNSNSKSDENEKNLEDNNDNFFLFEENKKENLNIKENKNKKENKNINNNEQTISNDELIDSIINKDRKKKNNILTKEKDKKEESIHISDSENENETETIKISSDDDSRDSTKKSKKYQYPKSKNKKEKEKKGNSKLTSKSKIDLEFLNIEEKEEESEKELKYYIQKPYDEEEEYKIIYEFNKLPFKPKIFIIDLSVFDDNSILKCISYCYFDKKELTFVLKLYFLYLSNKNELYNQKNSEETIMKFFMEKKEDDEKNKKEENVENNNNNENEYDLDKNIKLKIYLKRFKFIKGYSIQTGYNNPLIMKNDDLNEFHLVKLDEKEDLVNYLNYHKIFYILTIQKILLMISKKTLPEKRIGIQNEGNTCYMNSIIQSIYNNPFLLKNIMSINPDSKVFTKIQNEKINGNEDNNIISSLQNIFYKLYKYKYSIKITEIFNAFQWKRTFWNSPQDAEEIYMQIYEIISLYNEDIKENCEGILENTIEVVEKKYKSTKQEKFFFLQLDIENNNSLEECLEHFFNVEELNGDNKYQYEDNFGNKSLHDANKYYKFKKIPNLLFIQLKRFQYDPTEETFNKKNNGISFKEEIDLSNYLNNKKTKSRKKEEYILYCVIVHSGSAQNGHYYCFVKNFKNNCYIKFNDTSVYIAEKKEVFNEVYGGEIIEYTISNTSKNKDNPNYQVITKNKEITKNAYIFIYIKKDKIKDLFNNDKIKVIFEEYYKNKKKEEEKIELKKSNNNRKIDEYISNYVNNAIQKSPNAKKNYKGVGPRKTMIPDYDRMNNNYYNRDKLKSRASSNNINMNYEMSNFEEVLSQMGSCMNDYNNNYNIINNKISTKKRKTIYINLKSKSNNNDKIYNNKDSKTISQMNYPKNGLNDNKTYYYLINDILNRIKGIFLLKHNTKIKVTEVPFIISEQLEKEKIHRNNLKIFSQIVNSDYYKLALINCLGIFIKFFDEKEDNDITKYLINNNDKNKIKHLCLYNLPRFGKNNKKGNNYFISITFIPNSILDQIISQNKDIYENLNCFQINVPAFIINEDIKSMENLVNRIKDIYIDYFRNNSEKNKNLKIYIITDNDILNKDILKISYTHLTEDNFVIYFESFGNKTYNTNLLVGY